MYIKSDLHVHTILSGHSSDDLTVDNIIRRCLQLRLKALGFAEHVTSEKDLERMSIIKECLLDESYGEMEIYVGAEVDANPLRCDGSLVVSEKKVEWFDYVIGSIHHFPRSTLAWWKKASPEVMKGLYEKWFDWTMRLVSNPTIDVLGHPGVLLGHHKIIKNFADEEILKDFDEIFRVAKKNDVAIELNELLAKKIGKLADSYWHIIKRAINKGVKISIGSDAHRLEDVGRLDWCNSVALMAGLKEESIFLPSKKHSG
jgi:histidinol-phosphatase (PHP family)